MVNKLFEDRFECETMQGILSWLIRHWGWLTNDGAYYFLDT